MLYIGTQNLDEKKLHEYRLKRTKHPKTTNSHKTVFLMRHVLLKKKIAFCHAYAYILILFTVNMLQVLL